MSGDRENGPGICQQPRNPLVPNRALRALLVALDEWVSEGQEPPAPGAATLGRHSRRPLAARGSFAVGRNGVGFPHIPGVTFNGLMTTGDLFDYGPVV